MLHLGRRGIAGLVTWLFIGVSALYVAFKFGEYIVATDGGYSEWSDFTSCSVSCGGGSHSRTRSCTKPIPQYSGRNCSRLGPAIETIVCNTAPCPVNGKYSPWGSFGSCTATCGGGTHTRSRACNNPAPQHGGKDCTAEGPSTEAATCNTNPCPVNGGYTEWSNWSACSVTCGTGKKTRKRTCTNPAPKDGGASCTEQKLGNEEEIADCSEKPCSTPRPIVHENVHVPASNNTSQK